MDFGGIMDNLSNLFRPVNMYFGWSLVHVTQPELFESFSVAKLIAVLDSICCNFQKFNYYLFCRYNQPAYFFVTESEINFSELEQFWGEKREAHLAKGALWDIDKEEFLNINLNSPFSDFLKVIQSQKGIFYDFIVYDGGIPHIIKVPESDYYAILFEESDGKISIMESRIIPTAVTYVRKVDDKISRQRVIFFEDKVDKDYYITLEHDVKLVLGYDETKDIFEISSIPRLKNEGDIERENRVLLLDENNQYSFDASKILLNHFICRQTPFGAPTFLYGEEYDVENEKNENLPSIGMLSYLIGGDTAIVARCPYGKFGDMVMILFDFHNSTLDFKNSFYDYEVVDANDEKIRSHLLLELLFKKDDSRIDRIFFDVTEKKVYDSKP